MKNKIFLIYILFLLLSKSYSQTSKSKVIYVYDTITVYDTVYVYDTIKEELLSDKITSIEKALLEIDTTNLKSQLTLFNKADTATILIDSILLSNNLNKKDTMKKNILSLAATTMLAQTVIAQNNTSIDSIYTKNLTDSAIISLISTSYPKQRDIAIFQKNDDPENLFEVILPVVNPKVVNS